MDYEHFLVAAARFVEFVDVAVLLLGALLAAGAFSRRLVRRAAFQGLSCFTDRPGPGDSGCELCLMAQ